MVKVPLVEKLVVHVAVFVLPEPLKATDPQPAIVTPLLVKATVPIGLVAVTVAVKVTSQPRRAGLEELVRVTVSATGPITACDSAGLDEGALPASPLYVATMLCIPADRVLVGHCARPLARATVPQPPTVLPSDVNFMVPVGLEPPLTVAVNVTRLPRLAGLSELDNVVVVRDVVDGFTTCDRTPLADPLFVKSPA